MLELRPTCESCPKALPCASTEACICSYECTFCAPCVDLLGNVCPNCGGGFTVRPVRPARNWKGNNHLGADPAFWHEEGGRHYREQILRRSCKVLVHGTAHMFGLPRCICYECVVNGSNHLAESDAKPLHLCPVCLRKLHHGIGFDPVKRYRDLGAHFRRQQWLEDLDWVNRQLSRLPVGPKSSKSD